MGHTSKRSLSTGSETSIRNLGMGTKITLITRADWANIPFVNETTIKLQSSDGEKGSYNLER